MGQLMSHPLTDKSIVLSGSPRFPSVLGSMQGYRLTQEDAHCQYSSRSLKIRFYDPFKKKTHHWRIAVFGVFDGHGGDECSKFMASTSNQYSNFIDSKSSVNDEENNNIPSMVKCVIYALENHKYGSIDDPKDKSKRKFSTIQGIVAQCLKDAFYLQDREYFRFHSSNSCGSTAIVAVILNDTHLFVANTGDSRCVLSTRHRGVKPMSFDHKPQHIGELLRINDDGGSVSLGRVGGVLSLSRAFGDFQFKEGIYGKKLKKKSPYQESQVTCEPDVMIHEINYSKDEFLVLACDGIWDVYSSKAIIQFIKYHLTLGLRIDGVMAKVLDHGLSQANSYTGVGFDNMTGIIVALNKNGESLQEWSNKMKTRLEKERGIA